MKKTLYILGVLSLLGICYVSGYHFTLARVQSEGVVPFSLTRETYFDGQLLATQHIYRESNGDFAEVVIQPDHDAHINLHLFSTGHLVGLTPDRAVRTHYSEVSLNESMSLKQALIRQASAHCRVGTSEFIDSTPVEILGQLTYHIRSAVPCKGSDNSSCGKIIDDWQAPALGCQTLKYTVGTDVVGRVTQLKIGEPDPAVFDEHPEFPIVPEKR